MDAARTFAAAERAYASGDAAGSAALLDRLPPHAAADPAVLHLRALALKAAGRLDEARTAFLRAIQAAPNDPRLASNFANLLRRTGHAEAALTLYDRALAISPFYRDARFNKALLLYELGRSSEARELLEQLCTADPADARAQSALGTILLALGALDEAEATLDRALALQPALASALDVRARLALERGDADAPRRFEAARAAAPHNLEAVHGTAEALEAAGSTDGMRLLAAALDERPDWIEGHRRLAAMRAEAGDAEFADHYDAAIARGADPTDLLVSKASMLAGADRFDDALDCLDAVPGGAPLLMRATYLGEAGRPEEGLALLAPLAGANDPGVQEARGRMQLRTGELDGAVAALERAVALAPESVRAWGHLELAWRATGSGRAAWLSGQPGLYAQHDIGLSAVELREAATLLRGLHRTRGHPLGQSLRHGTQTRGNLFRRREPLLARMHDALMSAIDAHVASLPPPDPGHPLLRHRGEKMRITGSWSVRLTASGFHVSHIHPAGVLSSACYIALPDRPFDAETMEGWLELGRAPPELGLDLPALAAFEPKPGRLVLFPSYLFHGTRPFADGERLTVAFDIVVS